MSWKQIKNETTLIHLYSMLSLGCVTFELSKVLSGLSPPMQISQRVVPKPHLSVAKLRFWEFSMHSGGTQGIRSTSTMGQNLEKQKAKMTTLCPCR